MDKERVLLQEREVYGIPKFYPYNELAKKFCQIAKTKTMTFETIELIRAMGYDVVTDRTPFQEPAAIEEKQNDII